jgi:hypothetical protein
MPDSRLPRPVRPDDRGERAGLERAGDAIDRDVPAEADRQVLGRKQRHKENLEGQGGSAALFSCWSEAVTKRITACS